MYLRASRTPKAELPVAPNNRPPSMHSLCWRREAEAKTLMAVQFQFFEKITFVSSLNIFWLLFRLPSEPFALFGMLRAVGSRNTSHLYE